MRNFKKILSLVLCMAMMLSVMVVGAGAAFKDQSKINNAEAVDACAALNIINGYTDGSFRPEGTITRAEACKMICVALNGGKEPTLGTSAKSSFTDTKGHWAEGYIESCVAQGIVAGIGGGKFNPNGNVTGTQFAKMLLIALGYNSDNEGYVGAAWEVEVNVDASAKGLYADLSGMDPSKALSRDNAAQMVWNALNAYEVEYKYNLVSENGQLVSKLVLQDKVGLDGKTKVTLLEDKYEADTAVGTFAGNSDVAGCEEGNIEITDATINGNKGSVTTFDFKYDFDLKYLGEEIKVLYKDSKDGVDGRLDDKDTIYGVYVTGATTVYNITKGDLQDADSGKIKFNDKQYKVDADDQGTIPVSINYKTAVNKNVSCFDKGGEYYKNSADTIKFIAKNGKIVSAYIMETQFAKIASINSTKLSLSGGVSTTGLVIEDNDVYTGAAKGDIVAVQKLYDDNYYVITKAELVEADVTASKSTTEVKVDGVYMKKCETTGSTAIGDYDLFAITDLGETYEFIVYGDYWVAAQQTTESAKDYAVVDKIDANYSSAVNPAVKLVKADGSKVTVSIDSDSDAGITAGQLVKYKTNNDGSVEMTKATVAPSGGAMADDTLNVIAQVGSFSYNKNTKQIAFGDGSKYATTADCVAFIEYDTGKYMVASADDLSSFDATAQTAAYVSLNDDGKVVAYKVVTANKPSNTASDEVYGFITSRGSEKIGDDTYVMLDVWTADGNVTLKTEDLSTAQDSALKAGAFIKFKAGTDVTNAADIVIVQPSKIRVDSYDEDRLLLTQKNGTQWPVDKDVALITIDWSENEGVEDQFTTIPTYDSEADTCNAAIITDTVDGVMKVVAVFIDVDGNIEG